MIHTDRIRSGFDAELMLGAQWFLNSITILMDNGVLTLPFGIQITQIDIVEGVQPGVDGGPWDLRLTTSIGLTFFATVQIVGSNFNFTSSNTNINPNGPPSNINFNIPMPPFGRLVPGSPILTKIIADDNDTRFDSAMVLLINISLRASHQALDPLPPTANIARGNANEVVSFLPSGKDIALGIPRATFGRITNDIWHSRLRDVNGNHPIMMPKSTKKKGDWNSVKLSMTKRRIKFSILGEVPIDFWPDADVTLDIELRPRIVDGSLKFELKQDLDVDTGPWGDFLAFLTAGAFGFPLMILSGGMHGFGGVVLLEVLESIEGDRLASKLFSKQQLNAVNCSNGILQFSTETPGPTDINFTILDAIPSRIAIFQDNTDSFNLRTVFNASTYDDITLNKNGLAVAGTSMSSDRFRPFIVRPIQSVYVDEELSAVVYELTYLITSVNADAPPTATLSIPQMFERLQDNELRAPLLDSGSFVNPLITLPNGRLACACLTATNVRRSNGVVTRIKFNTGLELNTQDAVILAENALINVQGLQLIKNPKGNDFFRAPANDTPDDNFENLPSF